MRVTALMVTADRPHLARLSAEAFYEQTHNDKELLVVVDKPSDFDGPCLVSPYKNLAQKRDWAMAQVKTEFTAVWDDDDLHPNDRLDRQAAALGNFLVCGGTSLTLWDLRNDTVCSPLRSPIFPLPATLFGRTEILKSACDPRLSPVAQHYHWLHKQHHKNFSVIELSVIATVHGSNLTPYKRYPNWVPRTFVADERWLAT